MSDQNRGAYTPQSEAPLAFDARHSRGPGERPTPFALLASAGVLVILIIALAVFFLNGSKGSDPEAPAPIDTMKAAPPVADAKPAAPTGLQVYADGEPIPEAPAFTPAPEAPTSRPATPAPAPVAQPAAPAAPRSQPAPRPEPAPAAVPAARPAEPAPARNPTTPPPTSTAQVQIGAFSSSSLADDGWNDIARLMPGQMAGKTKRVEPTTTDGKTLYRAAVGGFTSRQEAVAFCDALKARGRACLVRN
jgi:cell division protein FtsN